MLLLSTIVLNSALNVAIDAAEVDVDETTMTEILCISWQWHISGRSALGPLVLPIPHLLYLR